MKKQQILFLIQDTLDSYASDLLGLAEETNCEEAINWTSSLANYLSKKTADNQQLKGDELRTIYTQLTDIDCTHIDPQNLPDEDYTVEAAEYVGSLQAYGYSLNQLLKLMNWR